MGRCLIFYNTLSIDTCINNYNSRHIIKYIIWVNICLRHRPNITSTLLLDTIVNNHRKNVIIIFYTVIDNKYKKMFC